LRESRFNGIVEISLGATRYNGHAERDPVGELSAFDLEIELENNNLVAPNFDTNRNWMNI
jgi:hypothetical protein